MIAREKLPSLSFPAGVSQVDTASREKATIAVIIFFCIISIISAVIFVIVNSRYWYDIILIVVLALHCLSCAQRDVSIKGQLLRYFWVGLQSTHQREQPRCWTFSPMMENLRTTKKNNIIAIMHIAGTGHWHLHQQWHHPCRWPCCVKSAGWSGGIKAISINFRLKIKQLGLYQVR